MKRKDFNEGWSFWKEGHETKVKQVNLPHDAMLYEERDPNCKNGGTTGYFPGGTYVYRKEFYVDDRYLDQSVVLEFEGVYQNTTIYINGKEVYTHPYGYTGFLVYIDEHLKINEMNTVKVLVENSGEPNTRWYSGSGIYRPVWMYMAEKTHIKVDGIKVKTCSINPSRIQVKTNATGGEAKVKILYNGEVIEQSVGVDVYLDIPNGKLWSDESPNLYECHVELVEDGEVIDTASTNFGIRIIEWGTNGLFINGKETKLRGSCVHHDNGILGACEFPAAAKRRVKILKESGFNAIRSAHNPCSKAILDACDELGLYVMDEFVDMWYEPKSRYDYAKDFYEWHEKDLFAMVEKGYSHPSVIMYSIGNEVTETSEEEGIALTKKMSDYVRSLDDTRPVTCGINMALNTMQFGGFGVYQPEADESPKKVRKKNPRALKLLEEQKKNQPAKGLASNDIFSQSSNTIERKDGKLVGSEYFNEVMLAIKEQQRQVVKGEIAKVLSEDAYATLDIAGYNYADGRYYLDKEEYPDRVSVGSETLPQRIWNNWQAVKELPYIIGDFMWTGWDYLGEAGVGSFCYDSHGVRSREYPAVLAGCGTIL